MSINAAPIGCGIIADKGKPNVTMHLRYHTLIEHYLSWLWREGTNEALRNLYRFGAQPSDTSSLSGPGLGEVVVVDRWSTVGGKGAKGLRRASE